MRMNFDARPTPSPRADSVMPVPRPDPLPGCFGVDRMDGSDACEFCRDDAPLIDQACKLACDAKAEDKADLSLCQDFGHFDAKRYQCVRCWRSRPGHSKLECKEATVRRAAEARAGPEERQTDQAKAEQESAKRHGELQAIREALSAEIQAELRETAEGSLNGFMARKLAEEKRKGELKPTTRLAIEAELDRITEIRFGT